MTTMTTKELEDVIGSPEVQELMQRLATYGLGICLPHSHDDSDATAPLPAGVVQFEEGLRVSFVPEDDPRLVGAVPVSWKWDGGVRVVGRCRQGHGV